MQVTISSIVDDSGSMRRAKSMAKLASVFAVCPHPAGIQV